MTRTLAAAIALALTGGAAQPLHTDSAFAAPCARAASPAEIGVGAQYDTTHVYVDPVDVVQFVGSFLATFGGTSTKQVVATVTPTPSKTTSQLLLTPVGRLSVFGFKTPIPYPFGLERTGYLVADMDAAIEAARASGADVIVAPFDDAIGRDAIVQWPGGVKMQFYCHASIPAYAPLVTIPENRVYVSEDRAAAFINSFVAFSRGQILTDEARAPGIEIGRPSETFRRVRIMSGFGLVTVLVTDGHLAYPYGRETTGYEVINIADTIAKSKNAGVKVLVEPYAIDKRTAAMLQFPGGYIAEIHALNEK